MDKYNMEIEVWKDIDGYEGYYQVSNLGGVRSVDRIVLYKNGQKRFHAGKVIKPQMDYQGYLRVGLNVSGNFKTYRIHRLVVLNFLTNKENKDQVNHINGIKNDNRLLNLEWVTGSENIKHARKTGLIKDTNERAPKHGSLNPNSKLNETDVKNIRKLRKEGFKLKELSDIYQVSVVHLSNICNHKYWKRENTF